MSKHHKYSEIRDHIKNGDIIGISCSGKLRFLTKWAQRRAGLGECSKFTHVAVAWWINVGNEEHENWRLMAVEMDGLHNVYRPLSQHIANGCGVSIFRSGVSPTEMAKHLRRATEESIDYDIIDLLRIGLRLIFRGRSKSVDSKGKAVCSTWAAWWLILSNWAQPKDFPKRASPGELCRALGDPIYQFENL